MDDPVEVALRKKKDSSMRVALNRVKEGEAQACISAGQHRRADGVSPLRAENAAGHRTPGDCVRDCPIPMATR